MNDNKTCSEIPTTMKHSTLLLCFLLFVSCSGQDSRLEQALDFAGENRSELEKVLEHYEDSPEKCHIQHKHPDQSTTWKITLYVKYILKTHPKTDAQ